MIVVDCSAVVDALTVVDGTDDLRAFLEREELCAPTLLDFEVVSALRGLTLRGHLAATRAQDVLTDSKTCSCGVGPSATACGAERSNCATGCQRMTPLTSSSPRRWTVRY